MNTVNQGIYKSVEIKNKYLVSFLLLILSHESTIRITDQMRNICVKNAHKGYLSKGFQGQSHLVINNSYLMYVKCVKISHLLKNKIIHIECFKVKVILS